MRRTRVLPPAKPLAQGRIDSARASAMGGVPMRLAAWGGKKKMRSLGTVQIPTDAFMAVLKLDEE